jgi:hypothetical protein
MAIKKEEMDDAARNRLENILRLHPHIDGKRILIPVQEHQRVYEAKNKDRMKFLSGLGELGIATSLSGFVGYEAYQAANHPSAYNVIIATIFSLPFAVPALVWAKDGLSSIISSAGRVIRTFGDKVYSSPLSEQERMFSDYVHWGEK